MSEEVLTKEEISHLKSLIKSEEAEAIAEARKLLDDRNTNADDLKKLFSKAAIYKLLSTWDSAIWDDVCELLSNKEMLDTLREQIAKRSNSSSQNPAAQQEQTNNLINLAQNCGPTALRLLGELCLRDRWVSVLSDSDSHIALAQGLVIRTNNDPDDYGVGLFELKKLGEKPAQELLEAQGALMFDCLSELSDPLAEILSTHKYGLHFSIPSMPSLGDGLVKLSDQSAESFSRHQGKLELQSLKELSDKGAEHLSKHPNLVINERGDQQEIADLIISKRGPITKEIVARFLEDDQSVRLDGYSTINEDAVDALSNYQGHINLDGLKEISDESLQKLSSHKSWLSLRGLTELSDAQAESLSRYGQDVSHLCILTLIGLKNLSDTAAQFLAKAKGRVDVVEELEEKINQYRES